MHGLVFSGSFFDAFLNARFSSAFQFVMTMAVALSLRPSKRTTGSKKSIRMVKKYKQQLILLKNLLKYLIWTSEYHRVVGQTVSKSSVVQTNLYDFKTFFDVLLTLHWLKRAKGDSFDVPTFQKQTGSGML